MKSESILLVGDSERDPNILYATGLITPSRIIYIRHRDRCFAVVNDPDLARVLTRTSNCRVLLASRLVPEHSWRNDKNPAVAHLIHLFAKEHRIKKFVVPDNFPYGLARSLRRLKVRLKVRPSRLFFHEREFKTPEEVKKISAAVIMAEVGMAEAVLALKNARVAKGSRLTFQGSPLTVERLRSIIDNAVFQAGGLPTATAVFVGPNFESAPHPSTGQLYVNKPIVVQISARSQKTGYYGMITRTVAKGHVSEALKRLYTTVAAAQDLAIKAIRPGVAGSDICQVVTAHYRGTGYEVPRQSTRKRLLFRDIGHGLGLEPVEPPCLSHEGNDILAQGHVVTVQPELYCPRVGCVKLLEVVVVTTNGARNLTQFQKTLEI